MNQQKRHLVSMMVAIAVGVFVTLNVTRCCWYGSPPRVTVKDLISNPERWDGHTVELAGYMIDTDGFESQPLVWNSEADAAQGYKGRYVRLFTSVSPPRIRHESPMPRHGPAWVIGIFQAKSSNVMYPDGQLIEITQMKDAKSGPQP